MSDLKRPYPWKPRFLSQPLWWWLGERRNWPPGWPTPGNKNFLERLAMIGRRGRGVRPHPVRSVREIYERGRNGYTLSDTWSLDGYLISWLPEAIADLRKGSHGHPAGICDSAHDGSDNDRECNGIEKWDEALAKMENGFLAMRQILDLSYYEDGTPWDEVHRREAALQAEFDEGMALFAEWFAALWN